MTRRLALLFALVVAAPTRGADTDLVFPDGEKSARLRLEVTDGGKSPEAAWNAFLDKLFAHFDRDGNVALSEAEAKRVFPLPLPDGKEVAPDFTALDANRDGKVTPEEFRAFYRARGFTPVAVIVRAAPAEVLAPGDALFRSLDRDGDGALSAAELRGAVALLKRFDEDEDETLAAKELLNTGAVGIKPAGLTFAPAEMTAPGATLRLALDGKATLAGTSRGFGLSAEGARLQVPGGNCAVVATKDDPAAGFRAAKSFYLAQFKAASGDKPVSKGAFEDDPTNQVLVGLFDAADRDGDGKLARAELDAFFDLIELGIGCRAVVTVTDRGRNLFDLLDADGDGELDLTELARAAKALPDQLARDEPLARAAVPAAYRLAVGRGPVGNSFGPVPFGAVAKAMPSPALPVARGPAWFRAQDKNGDGFVSAREFVGSPARFAKLDTNGDGRISLEEAEAAKP